MTKTIVITGASDGIGAAAARRLHLAGHRVVVVGRSPEKTRAVAGSIGTADFHIADFTRLADVRDLAGALIEKYPRIDVLANNAGGIFGERAKTVDGFEKTFQVNHLAPFLLTNLLLETLIASRASVVQTASIGARLAPRLGVDDLDLHRNYSPIRAYGAAKLENILFTRELDRRHGGSGIAAAAFHPGAVASSFGSTTSSRLMKFIAASPIVRSRMITPEQGAEQLVWLAEGTPGADWVPGTYYENHQPGRTHAQADDQDLARHLWDRSEELLAGRVA